ncbi:MAG TPA: helix-turn-helix domain-containing protein [Pirellulales bacterium]|jgi:excisionase family DNA binding protein
MVGLPTSPLPELLTQTEAAKLLNCSDRHVYNLFRRGKLARHYVGACVRYKRSDILALIEDGRKEANADGRDIYSTQR